MLFKSFNQFSILYCNCMTAHLCYIYLLMYFSFWKLSACWCAICPHNKCYKEQTSHTSQFWTISFDWNIEYSMRKDIWTDKCYWLGVQACNDLEWCVMKGTHKVKIHFGIFPIPPILFWLYWPFVFTLNPSRQMLRQYFKCHRDRFLEHASQFLHQICHHLMLYSRFDQLIDPWVLHFSKQLSQEPCFNAIKYFLHMWCAAYFFSSTRSMLISVSYESPSFRKTF